MGNTRKPGPNKAKSLIAQPLFRSRQEKPKKGKGSYRREASQQNWEASFVRAFSVVFEIWKFIHVFTS